MKKVYSVILALSILTLCVFLVTSCSSGKLPEPDGFTLNEQTLTLSWNKVRGAMSYTIQIEGEERERTTRTNSISLEYLEAGTYEIKVKTVGDDIETKDSKWSTYTFVREPESGLKYDLVNGNTEYQVVGAGTASGDVVVDAVYRGKPVTSIADKAFYNNSKITSITVGSNIKKIGERAFAKCSQLTSVIIENGVTEIGEKAFQSSKALVTVSLPDSVTEVSPYMFSWCSALENLTLGNSITTVGEYAFSNCKALKTVTLPNTVKSIGEYAFSDCETMTSISLGSNLVSIAEQAFTNCSALNNLTLPNTLESIGPATFYNCAAISAIAIPDSVKTVGVQAFLNCTSLSDVKIGTGVTQIGKETFYNTAFYNNATGIVTVDGWVIEAKDKEITAIILPEGIYGIADSAFLGCEKLDQVSLKGIKYIGNHAFKLCSNMWECVFDDSLLTIGDAAFSRCEYLKTIDVGSSLQSIGTQTFYGCSMLNSDGIELPKSLKSIGMWAFQESRAEKETKRNNSIVVDDWVVGNTFDGMSAFLSFSVPEGIRGIADYSYLKTLLIGSITIPDGVEIIGRCAFYKTAGPREISLPSTTLQYIGDYAFYGCSYASFGENYSLSIPVGVEYIGRSAFYECSSIVSLTIPSSVKTIGDYAFYGCKSLGLKAEAEGEAPAINGSVTIANGVESIGIRAFQYCESLTEIVLPESLTQIGSHLFYKCLALKSVTINGPIEAINEYTFFKCAALETVTLPNTVKTVGKYAFRGCEHLTAIHLPAVESIGNYAFYQCVGLTEFIIPDSLTEMGDYAIRGCTGIKTLIVPSTVSSLGKHVFYGMRNVTLYCETENIPSEWNERFNSSYLPIFFGCELSDDNSYVVSFTFSATNPDNAEGGNNVLSAPTRDGYTFAGWTTVKDGQTVEYSMENFNTAPTGTKLYAIWTK